MRTMLKDYTTDALKLYRAELREEYASNRKALKDAEIILNAIKHVLKGRDEE